jgi:hypothetical protein
MTARDVLQHLSMTCTTGALASIVQCQSAGRATTMHNCTGCRRTLSNSSRNALCLRCLYLLDRGRPFDDEPETRPGKRPSSIAVEVVAVDAAA